MTFDQTKQKVVETVPSRIRVFISAAEASGDLFGSHIMKELKKQCGHDRVEFVGIGGPYMAAEGLQSMFPIEDITAFGFFEVLPKLPLILRRMREVTHFLEHEKLDAILTIDAPDFHFRLLRRLHKVLKKRKSTVTAHFVAPSVWAWRKGRAKSISGLMDLLFCILPFEPDYFIPHGQEALFMGHPLLETVIYSDERREAYRKTLDLDEKDQLVLLLPGSRASEINRLLPKMLEVAEGLEKERKKPLLFMLPVAPNMKPVIEPYLEGLSIQVVLLTDMSQKYDAFAAADFALAASGTVSLELALMQTPHVIMYELPYLTGLLAKRLIKTPFVNLINILLKFEVVPEFLQERCDADLILEEVQEMLSSEVYQNKQLDCFGQAIEQLKREDQTASAYAVDVILDALSHRSWR